ncbi:GNAT family N-acetyltransferase [Streptomyces sp. NPDC021093]|uniref:GNAT family N-acetyltransferase n=1 Tax=Streptomyces sp. NPDC021093 TaxID=3365112 RepID=UPI0037AAC5EA
MIHRSIVESDLDRFLPLLVADPASTLTADLYRAKLADGQYRPEWTWIAEDPSGVPSGGVPLAVAVWWGNRGEPTPGALDAVYVHESVGSPAQRTALAAELLTSAHAAYARDGAAVPPAFHIFLPGDWRERPDVVAALEWRREVARHAGLPRSLERLRYEWTPAAGVSAPTSGPPLSGRLRFSAEPDDEVFVDLFRRVLEDTLDATTRRAAEQVGTAQQARADVEFYRDHMLGDRSWWRVARTPEGEAVGFGLPSRNNGGPVVGYLGVLPEHRGRGYVDEILAEITRILVAETDPAHIRSDTDLTNTPTAAAMERAGYRNFARRLVLSAD